MSQRDRRVPRKADDSIFKLPIENSLGIEAMEARARLKNWAIASPQEYVKFRSEVYLETVRTMVQYNHKIIWDLLEDGIIPGTGEVMKVNGDKWSPALPDAEIGKLSNSFAQSIMDAFDEILSKVLPDDYKKLSEDKLMEMNTKKNLLQ